MIEHDRGETVYITVETRDQDDALTAASSASTEISDSKGTVLLKGQMTQKSIGMHTYGFNIPSSVSSGDTLTVKIKVTDASDFVTIKKLDFKVR